MKAGASSATKRATSNATVQTTAGVADPWTVAMAATATTTVPRAAGLRVAITAAAEVAATTWALGRDPHTTGTTRGLPLGDSTPDRRRTKAGIATTAASELRAKKRRQI